MDIKNTIENSNNLIFSLDIGTRSIKGAVLENHKGKLKVITEEYIEHEERAMHDGQIHNIPSVARTVLEIKNRLESKLDIKLKDVAIAAAGRFLKTMVVTCEEELSEEIEIDKNFINALELSAIKKAEKEINKNISTENTNPNNETKLETKLYCVGHTIQNYFLNGYTISSLLSHRGKVAGVELIATFLPSSVVDSLYAVMKIVNLNISTLTLEPIAAIEAIIPPNLRLLNLALIDVGAGTSDIAISSKDSITGYGMVPLAGDEVTEVISQNYLLDFNSGEELKKKFSSGKELTYKDILGFDYSTTTEEMVKILDPVVENISSKIAKEILSLNDNKSPSAVFLIGGGAHTPMLIDKLADKLQLPKQRIAIKGRESITSCSFSDLSLGSIGVTVLGIALIAANKNFENYIEVSLNNSPVTLFNLNNTKICDVLVQASINPKLLIGRNGEDVSFTINNVPYKALGQPPTVAKIYLNNQEASLDSIVKEGDKIEVIYAKNGVNASPKIYEYLSPIHDNINFYIDDKLYIIEPKLYINNKIVYADSLIHEGDNVKITIDNAISNLYDNYGDTFINSSFYINAIKLENDYIIKPEDRIYTSLSDSIDDGIDNNINTEPLVTENKNESQNINIINRHNNKYNSGHDHDLSINNKSNIRSNTNMDTNTESNTISINKNITISVLVNNKPVELIGKSNYIFIDIFDFINFDRSKPKGILTLKHNGNNASYFSPLCNGDIIEISWQ